MRDHLSARAGIGARCSQYEAAEAADSPPEAAYDDAPAAALAAVTACLWGLSDDVVESIVAEADTDVTKVLAGLLAWCIRETDGGPEWLRCLALDWAAEGAV
ncbi:hypothetical protein [Streptacidiphilus anmyonensis]|uniref:hypothetical protein n=1 Tax=Streptacidiphilus anmyonensis TaxID=405782 RepID=UPI000A495D64